MGKMNNNIIIADTSALISLIVPTDHNHKVAVEAAKRLAELHTDIIVINAIYVEFLNVLGKQYDHKTALAAADMFTPPFVILNEPQDIPASGVLEKFADLPQAVSLTDCLVMVTADAYRTKEIFGFDKQFADAGYTRLTPSTEWQEGNR
jgi:predicted nucleic acid-binding protein